MDIKKAQFRIEHLTVCSSGMTYILEFGTTNMRIIFESAKQNNVYFTNHRWFQNVCLTLRHANFQL